MLHAYWYLRLAISTCSKICCIKLAISSKKIVSSCDYWATPHFFLKPYFVSWKISIFCCKFFFALVWFKFLFCTYTIFRSARSSLTHFCEKKKVNEKVSEYQLLANCFRNGHLLSRGWSPTNPRIVTQQKDVYYRLGILHLDFKKKN